MYNKIHVFAREGREEKNIPGNLTEMLIDFIYFILQINVIYKIKV
jgi:hypothetical protein